MNYKIITRTGLYLTLFILLALTSMASFTSQWGEYGDDPLAYANVADSYGFWGDLTELPAVTTIAVGSNFQPLSFDADNDGYNEIIVSNGNYIQIYDLTSNYFALKDELSLGATQTTMMTAIDSYDGDDYIEFVGIFGTDVYVLEYNGSAINIENNMSINGNAVTGIRCFDVSGTNICYWGNDAGNITEYNPVTNGIADYNISGSDVFSNTYSEYYSPPVEDIDRDGYNEMVFIYSENIAIIDQNSMSLQQLITISGSVQVPPILYNIDGAGDTEIITTSYNSDHTDGDVWLSVYKPNGDQYWQNVLLVDPASTTTWGEVSTPVIGDFLAGYSQAQVCAILNFEADGDIANSYTGVRCFKYDGTFIYSNNTFTGDGTDDYLIKNGYTIAAASMTEDDDSYDDIITPSAIISIDIDNSSTVINLTNDLSTYYDYYGIVVDVDNDNNLDVCGQQLSASYCAFSTYTNVAPTFTDARNLGQNYASPLCIGTTIKFTARECGTQPCHYTNDIAIDQERLVSTCGINETYYNGSYSLGNPYLSCTYNQVGTYNVRIYIQDEDNTDTYAEYKDVVLNVVNGTAGVTCNLPISSEVLNGANITSVVSADQITSESEMKETIEIVTGQSNFVKTLLVLIFTIAMVLGLVKYGVQSPMVYVICVFTLWMCFALIGMLSWVYVLIFSMSLIGMGFFAFTKGQGGQ